MQYEFLKNFPKRMKTVGLYAILIQSSSQKQTWKQYGILKTDEQLNMVFAVMLYIMEQSLKEETCTMDDIGAYIDNINVQYFQKNMTYDDCRKLGDFIVNVILSNEGRAMYFDGYDFDQNAYHIMHISYVANKIVYIDQELKRTSYYLTDDAAQVLRQLDTTIQSYDSLMEKLEVDISVVEKEKDRIVELMEEYVREVHQNLGMIDRNSTITIRERPIKMLKIQLPEWEENENLYHIRLQDMIDEVTLKGVELFEKNENAQEYFGTRITTRNLYDTVIGIGNVQIRLYKIEEQREYPITWAEVAKNSGGEGFLSAFVILSSLLYYMRKDDTDIFADRNEGKVLVMDNPFAQTNASHLLKPLMDMAKKTNTQLICLSGLGGESIYNRFDNIYVLNLIAASLRNGMQYLKADHVRGNEPETMVVSQIEVMEQQELIF